MMGNYHARCGAGEKPEVKKLKFLTPEAYLSLFGQIPKFEKLIATIRSREISASIILQSKSQLKAIYKDNADTIEGNCDTMLFLGGKEKTTLKELAEVLGKETDKLAEYKPLAKVEELEEANYNMIDNVLDNEKPKKEEERLLGRISIKEKLAEKKAMIEHRDKGNKPLIEKDTEKKQQREM